MKKRTVVILAKPGELRDGIEALFAAVPQVDTVYCKSNVNVSGSRLAKLGADLLVFNLTKTGQSVNNQLRQIKQRLPSIKVLTIVDTKEAKTKRDNRYSDVTLVKGFRGGRFIEPVLWGQNFRPGDKRELGQFLYEERF